MIITPTFFGNLLLLFILSLSPYQQRGKRHTIEIHNHTDKPLQRIYVSATTEDDWGDDRLGKDTLSPDHYWPVEVPEGEYDFKIVGKSGLKPCMVMEERIDADTKLEVIENKSETELRCKIDPNIQ